MRTRPYVFLANLAVADLSVGIFCVLPSLSTFLSPVWLLGKIMCKVYYFVQGMSYMTSILLLTVISVERFVATMFPLQANQIFTPRRLVLAQGQVRHFLTNHALDSETGICFS
ncbi:hypothetical protein LOTGIDRAFT_173253 [Lottia gigantea]|uniref:G-protein coupled receptors family 1 profile domain-containing protein n=1 Tax=Lottia gigantea TaxID=225164 RepID=V4CEI6_LOTGI|nr:hypothetical protein LOTGIDRAFT_173253 [Lottia gigantea]ESP00350.1 hypothetical protein LOTGIDRAFT_173253 [Lottia gigantea]